MTQYVSNSDKHYYGFIDGLRAVAVLMVLIFHLNPAWLSGGFIGVDIFFTISGFLITKIAINRCNASGFYFDFLLGRFRRLYPAYAAAIIFTLFASTIILLPSELKELTKAALTSSLVASNIYYYLSSDYFDATLSNLALLHTWSLSVEWQFYLAYPLLLFIGFFRRNILVWLCFIFCVSLVITNLTVLNDKSGAFYLTQFRIYEFAAGGILATISRENLKRIQVKLNSFTTNLLGFLSLFGLFIASCLYDDYTMFPGVTAALINILTALIILLGMSHHEKLLFRHMLSLRPIVYIGRISYSLYLFHWPVIVFFDLYFQGQKGTIFYLSVLSTTFILSHLTFKHIENRYRYNGTADNRAAIGIAVVTTCFALLFFITSKFTNGLDSRFSKAQLEVLNVLKWEDFPGHCQDTHASSEYYNCIIGNNERKPDLLIIGDSHAQMLAWEFDNQLSKQNRSAVFITKGGCPPLLYGVPVNTSINKEKCFSTQQKVEEAVGKTPTIKRVFIASRWANYKDQNFDKRFAKDAGDFDNRFTDTLLYFKEQNIATFVLQAIPEPGYSVPERLVRADIFDLEVDKTPYNASLELEINNFEGLIDNILSVKNLFCSDGECVSHFDGTPLYFDSNHTTREGSAIIVKHYFHTEITDNNIN